MENIIEYLKAERSQDWRNELRKGTKAKERTNIERVNMPEEDPFVRNQCNVEVNTGLSTEAAILEAKLKHKPLCCTHRTKLLVPSSELLI